MNKRDAIIKLTQDICGGYAAILFAESSYIGLMFLLATFWFPNIGGAGLIAVLMAVAIAQCLKFRNLNSGLHIYNSLSLGAHYKLDTHLLLLLFLASLLTVFSV